jgi:hypothetical protein
VDDGKSMLIPCHQQDDESKPNKSNQGSLRTPGWSSNYCPYAMASVHDGVLLPAVDTASPPSCRRAPSSIQSPSESEVTLTFYFIKTFL